MPKKTKAVKRAGKRVDPPGCTCAELSARYIIARPRRGHFKDCACAAAPEDVRAAEKAHAALAFVRELAKAWVYEGRAGDAPGTAQAAFDLLVKHGETAS
jgi:hypothetical protein